MKVKELIRILQKKDQEKEVILQGNPGMKVKELIRILQKKDQEKEVILQRNPGGNYYRALYSINDKAVYTENYDIYFMDEQEWIDLKKNNKDCVVLYPF